jgi:hypothetical protein
MELELIGNRTGDSGLTVQGPDCLIADTPLFLTVLLLFSLGWTGGSG